MAIYIDDDIDKLAPLVGIVPYLFLFSWPYNLAEDERNIAKRIFSWQEFYREIQQLRKV
ncbi:MAG TPA: hypothetical protein VJJ80_02755 [Patescibacteria group bacterium]|nr:hypothetical protein [Patescibacteria group bacterium]